MTPIAQAALEIDAAEDVSSTDLVKTNADSMPELDDSSESIALKNTEDLEEPGSSLGPEPRNSLGFDDAIQIFKIVKNPKLLMPKFLQLHKKRLMHLMLTHDVESRAGMMDKLLTQLCDILIDCKYVRVFDATSVEHDLASGSW